MGKLNLSHFNVDDVSAVCSIIVKEAGRSVLPEASSHPTFKNLVTLSEAYSSSLGRSKDSLKAISAQQADRRRDTAEVGLQKSVEALTYLADPAKRAKAEILSHRLDRFKGIQDLPSSQETVEMNQLIALLNEPENATLVADLGLQSFVQELKEANAAYEACWDNRERDVAEFRSSQSASTLRRQVEYAINRYYDFLLMNVEYAGNREWGALQQAIYSQYLTLRQKYQPTTPKEGTPPKA